MHADLLLLQSLLDLLPFTSDDLEARNALWSVLARLLLRVKDIEMSPFSLYQYVSALVGKSSLIEDALLDSEWDRPSENNEMLTTSEAKLNSKTSAVSYSFVLSKYRLCCSHFLAFLSSHTNCIFCGIPSSLIHKCLNTCIV